MKQTQHNQILTLLSDYQKHCFTNELYMKDDRVRISELRKMGYVFNEDAGWCSDPKHRHGAKVKLRQLISELHAQPSKPISLPEKRKTPP